MPHSAESSLPGQAGDEWNDLGKALEPKLQAETFVVSAREADTGEKICLECNREFTGIISNCPHDNSLLFTRAKDHLIGTTLANKYEISSRIGEGGMGIVYKGRHILMDKTVAIKVLQHQLLGDHTSVKRFQHEAKAASKIDHPHVIKVLDFGISTSGQPYIVMDFLHGIALADVIKQDGHVSVERTIRIISQACEALDHAHKQGLVHRDLKPTNIVLVTFDDEPDYVKVVDFGVAKFINGTQEGQKLTQQGEVCGSPVYMSPEQCLGMDLDHRSDVYSMGIVIYESLTGKLPIIGKTMVDTMSKHINEMPQRFNEVTPDLYIPERLEAIVFKALAKDPAHRHSSMEELRLELELARAGLGRNPSMRINNAKLREKASPAVAEERLRFSNTMLSVVGTLLILVLGGFFVAVAWKLQPVHAPGAAAQLQAAPETAAQTRAAPAATPPSASNTVVSSTPSTAATAQAHEQTPPKARSTNASPAVPRSASDSQLAPAHATAAVKPAAHPHSKLPAKPKRPAAPHKYSPDD